MIMTRSLLNCTCHATSRRSREHKNATVNGSWDLQGAFSEIGLFTEDDKLAQFYTLKDHHETKLIPKDGIIGKKVDFDSLGVDTDPSLDKPKTTMWFRDVIDVSKYDGIEINGVKYTEE